MKKYCSVCRKPLADPNAAICDKCGKPTMPVDFFNRAASDNILSSREKTLLEVIGIFTVVACAFSIFQCLLINGIFANQIKQLQYQIEIGWIENSPENLAKIGAYSATANVFKIITTFIIIEQLATAVLGIMVALKKAGAVRIAQVIYIINAVLYLLSANIISAVIEIVLAVKLGGIISKMKGGLKYAEAAESAADVPFDPANWQCKFCGYINPNTISECKSCGKWKN